MKDDRVTKAVKAVMSHMLEEEVVKEEEFEGVMVTELPLLLPEVVSSQPAPLPSLMCCTSEYTPGTVLQVIRGIDFPQCVDLFSFAGMPPNS